MFKYQTVVFLALLAGQSAAFQTPYSVTIKGGAKKSLDASVVQEAPLTRKLVPLSADGTLQTGKAKSEEENRRLQIQAARVRAEENAARLKDEARAAEAARIEVEDRLMEQVRAAEAARIKAEEDAARVEAARVKAEEQEAAEAARVKAEEDAARLKKEEEARLKKKAEEEERLSREKAERIYAAQAAEKELASSAPFFALDHNAADEQADQSESNAPEMDVSSGSLRAGAFQATSMQPSPQASQQKMFPEMNLEFLGDNKATKDDDTAMQSAAVTQEKQAESSALGIDLSKVSNVLTPGEAFELLVQKGEYNAAASTFKTLFSAALGGCYVGMGAMVSLAVAGNSPDLAAADPGLYKFLFAALFPMNLLLAQQCGGSLYTGNTANMMAALCEGRVTAKDMGRTLGLSWVGNVVGCGFFALACKYAGVLEGGAGILAAQTLATKTSYELGPLLVKAMFCNWLVCLAVLLSTQAKDMGGKYVSIWLPVSTFVSIGFEHSVANMFLLPAGLMSQNDITLQTALVHNLLPVTVGNAISGALFVGATMSYLYGSLGEKVENIIGSAGEKFSKNLASEFLGEEAEKI